MIWLVLLIAFLWVVIKIDKTILSKGGSLESPIDPSRKNPFIKREKLYIESDDDFEVDVIAECYKTKKPVMKSKNKEV